MKKLLSVLLVCLLCLGCGVSAAALEEGEVEVETQGLMNPLPVVTAIEAEWSGEILIGHIMYALFTPENVTITAYYEDGEPEVLSRWEEIGIDWWWRVFPWSFDDSATFLYSDSNLQSAYYEVHGNFTNYYESLPQASIEFPENYVERYIETQMPLTAMKLGEMMTVQTLDAYRPQVLSFTPETSGWYSFENPWLYFSDFIRVMVIMDSNYEFLYHLHGLPSNDRNHFSRVYFLEVGQEYYIFARKSSNYFSYQFAKIRIRYINSKILSRIRSIHSNKYHIVGFIKLLPSNESESFTCGIIGRRGGIISPPN